MKTKMVSGIVTEKFDGVVNDAIEELEREGKEVLDIKFSSTFGTPDKLYALGNGRLRNGCKILGGEENDRKKCGF